MHAKATSAGTGHKGPLLSPALSLTEEAPTPMEGVLPSNTSRVPVSHRAQKRSPSSNCGVLTMEDWAVNQETWPWAPGSPSTAQVKGTHEDSGPCSSSPPLSRTQNLLEHLPISLTQVKTAGCFPQPELYTPYFLIF